MTGTNVLVKGLVQSLLCDLTAAFKNASFEKKNCSFYAAEMNIMHFNQYGLTWYVFHLYDLVYRSKMYVSTAF